MGSYQIALLLLLMQGITDPTWILSHDLDGDGKKERIYYQSETVPVVSYHQLNSDPEYVVTITVKHKGKYLKAGKVKAYKIEIFSRWDLKGPPKRAFIFFRVYTPRVQYFALDGKFRVFAVPKELFE